MTRFSGPKLIGVLCSLYIIGLIGIAGFAAGGFIVADAIRAFVGGEGQYAKAQKQAVIDLSQYGRTGDPIHLHAFNRHISVPVNGRHARILLEIASEDRNRIYSHLMKGGNHREDVPKMTWLFRLFHQTPLFRPALETWREGDQLIMELIDAAADLQSIVDGGGGHDDLNIVMDRIHRIDLELTNLEIRFSRQLGVSARQVETILFLSLTGLTLVLASAAVGFATHANQRFRKAEREAAARERRFNDIVEVSADWVWETDADYRFTFLSERLEVVSGLKRSFFMGHRRWECSREPTAEYWTLHKTDIETRRPFQNFEYSVTDKVGNPRIFRVSGKPVYAPDGQFLGFRGTGSDVTAEAEATRQLALKTELLEATLENIGHGVGVIDEDLRVVAMNELLFELLDFPKGQLGVGSAFEDFIRYNCERGEYGEVDAETYVASILGVCREFKPHSFVRERPNGRILQVRGHPLPSGGLVTTYHDITAERRAIEALEKSERRIREIVEAALDPFVSFDRDGFVADWNPAAEKTFGWSRSEACGRSLVDLIGMEDGHQFLQGLNNDGAPDPLEHGARLDAHCRSKFGEELVVDVAVSVQRGAEIPIYNAFIRDVTHRTEIEATLLTAKQEAEQANAAKSEFLAAMSHELRTPLNAIIGFSEVMVEQTFGPLQDRYLNYSDHIRASGQHLLSLINDILDISRVEAGRYELKNERVQLVSATNQCIAFMGPKAEQAGIRVVNKVPIDMPDLLADDRCVRQVLINLVGNAIKFSDKGGLVEVSASLDRKGLRVDVRDNGAGIPDDQVARVFEPFHQVDAGFARRFEGTGLGLALVKRFMELHEGTVALSSQEGVGTTVSIRFPKCRVVERDGTSRSRSITG